jgi:hypothetical protein
VLDAKASEHSARMVAMKTAKDNATKLLGDLTSNTTRPARRRSRRKSSKSPPRSSHRLNPSAHRSFSNPFHK